MPHAHILLFLHNVDKYHDPQELDNIISAEITDQQTNPKLYEIVSNFMMHGPCGHVRPTSPCMKSGRCSKFYPKSFVNLTTIDQDGFHVYKRRDDGRFIEKGGIFLDNQFVVPYNPQLLQKYASHINVEYCNQSSSIKYLFKYINKEVIELLLLYFKIIEMTQIMKTWMRSNNTWIAGIPIHCVFLKFYRIVTTVPLFSISTSHC